MPQAEVSSSIVCRYDNARLSSTQRTMAAGPSGGALAGLAAPVGDTPGHVAGGEEHRVVGVDQRSQGGRRLGQVHQLGELPCLPVKLPGTPALVEQPQAGAVAQ